MGVNFLNFNIKFAAFVPTSQFSFVVSRANKNALMVFWFFFAEFAPSLRFFQLVNLVHGLAKKVAQCGNVAAMIYK